MADNALKRRNALMDASQGVSRGFWADGIGGPVDMLTTLANLGIAGGGYAGHKLGLLSQPPSLIENPVGGSEWIAAKMRSNGLLNDNPGSTADAYGRVAGGLLAPLTAARAPQIANALQQAPAALQRGAYAVGERAAGMAENQLVKQGGILPVNPLQQRSGLLDSAPMKPTAPAYAMEHRPVTVEGGAARLHDLEPSFGPDIYGKDAAQFFGTGDTALDRQTIALLKQVRGKPDAMVTAYRAVPADANARAFNAGDWVTVNRNYAKMHGDSTLGGDYKIIEQKVPASSLTTNADSFHEQGYYPQ